MFKQLVYPAVVLFVNFVFFFEWYMSYAVPLFHKFADQLGGFFHIHCFVNGCQLFDNGFLLFQILLFNGTL